MKAGSPCHGTALGAGMPTAGLMVTNTCSRTGPIMKKLLALLVVLGLALAAGAYWINRSMGHRPPTADFTLAPVEYGPLSESVSATGTLKAEDTIEVGSSLPGRLVQIAADNNQRVLEGDVLARLDDRLAQQDLRDAGVAVQMARKGLVQARANRAAAERALEKQKSLPGDVGRKFDLEAAQNLLDAADAGVEVAEAQVEKAEEARRRAHLGLTATVIRVPHVMRSATNPALATILESDMQEALAVALGMWPFERHTYTVLDRRVEANQQIAPPLSARLFLLTPDLSKLRMNAQIAESDISKVHPGQAVEFTVSTYAQDDVHFQGVVRLVPTMPASATPTSIMPGGSALPGPVFYEVIVDVKNEPDSSGMGWRLRPGMTASLDIIQRKEDHVWKLPNAALTFQLDDAYQSEDAKKKLADWDNRPDRAQWRPIWVLNDQKEAWPVFVRIGGENALHDAQFQQVLEWDLEWSKKLDPRNSATSPRVITGAPPVGKGGLFNKGGPSIRF